MGFLRERAIGSPLAMYETWDLRVESGSVG